MLRARTGDQALVREINLSIILNALRDHAPVSRASLAATTGLNKTTVSSLVQQLIEANFVYEIGADRTEDTGRPGILLKLDPGAGRIVGVEIGVDFVSVIVTDFAAEIIWRRREQTDAHPSQEQIISHTLEIIKAGIEETDKEKTAVLGLGIGLPGLVDVKIGTLLFAPNLQWRDVNLRKILSSEFDFPVYVGNEANMATLGESYFGVARGAKSVLYVSAGVGLGGGIVLDGQILAGFAGEVGHMTLEIHGERCNCGNYGCWETLVSQEALFKRVRATARASETTSLFTHLHDEHDGLTVPRVVQAAAQGDRIAIEALNDTAFYLGVGLANLVNAFNPEILVFGGVLSVGSEFLMPVVRQTIRERALRWSVDSTQVLVAAYGLDSCVMGGVAAVYHQILSQPFTSLKSERGHAGSEASNWDAPIWHSKKRR